MARSSTHLFALLSTVLITLAFASASGYADETPNADELPLVKGGVHTDLKYGTIDNLDEYKGKNLDRKTRGFVRRQILDIYQADSRGPSPIYIWSHGNMMTHKSAKNFPFIKELNDIGISVISWESFLNMNGTNYPEIRDDAKAMWKWVKENGATYNLDIENVFIGGHSRGSIASWMLGLSGDPAIKGLYYVDAVVSLKSPVFKSQGFSKAVTKDSPPISMNYTRGRDVPNDVHKPSYGDTVTARYEEVGIGERAVNNKGQGFPGRNQEKPLGFYSEIVGFAKGLFEAEEVQPNAEKTIP